MVDALRTEIDSYKSRQDTQINFFCSARTLSVSNDASLAIFRIVQEALRNIAKYSEASNVDISINIIKDTFILQIKDDGIGFDVESARKPPGLRLKSMMERARLIGGKLDIESQEFQGTTIELHVADKRLA
ncbi:hypothetical protein A1QE_16090 [Vibrio breoganii ZF-55]|nr:hypothetical protein A1QE_16090 [Vibrio breoganii ZF-55]